MTYKVKWAGSGPDSVFVSGGCGQTHETMDGFLTCEGCEDSLDRNQHGPPSWRPVDPDEPMAPAVG